MIWWLGLGRGADRCKDAESGRVPEAAGAEVLLHGTCVAFGSRAVLLRGASGAGKSDLALRVLSAYPARTGGGGAALVADDQVQVTARAGVLQARAPTTIAGRLEVRGVGIVSVPHLREAALALVVDLVPAREVERLPPDPLPRTEILGIPIPVARLAAFEASSPAKLKLLVTGSL